MYSYTRCHRRQLHTQLLTAWYAWDGMSMAIIRPVRCHLVGSSVSSNIYAARVPRPLILTIFDSCLPCLCHRPAFRNEAFCCLTCVTLCECVGLFLIDCESSMTFFALASKSSTSFSFPGTKVPRYFRSRVFVPGSESSWERKFSYWYSAKCETRKCEWVFCEIRTRNERAKLGNQRNRNCETADDVNKERTRERRAAHLRQGRRSNDVISRRIEATGGNIKVHCRDYFTVNVGRGR